MPAEDNKGWGTFEIGQFVELRNPDIAGGFTAALITTFKTKFSGRVFRVIDFEMRGTCTCGMGSKKSEHYGTCPIKRANSNPQWLTLLGVTEIPNASLFLLAEASPREEKNVPAPAPSPAVVAFPSSSPSRLASSTPMLPRQPTGRPPAPSRAPSRQPPPPDGDPPPTAA